MPTASLAVERLLAQDFFARHPEEAADHLETVAPSEADEMLSQVAPETCIEALRLSPAKAHGDRPRSRKLIRKTLPRRCIVGRTRDTTP